MVSAPRCSCSASDPHTFLAVTSPLHLCPLLPRPFACGAGSMSVAWTETLAVGVPAIDHELQGCLDYAEQLMQTVLTDDGTGNNEVVCASTTHCDHRHATVAIRLSATATLDRAYWLAAGCHPFFTSLASTPVPSLFPLVPPRPRSTCTRWPYRYATPSRPTSSTRSA